MQAESGRELGERLAALLEDTHSDALNLRVHVHGVDPEPIRDQITRIGEEAVPVLHG